jgi:3-oxoacyl-[acyl-carrier-protein] synthase III
MIISKIKNIKIEAISACVPTNEIDNIEFSKKYFNEDLSSIIKAIGTLKRRECLNPMSSTIDLAKYAAESLFNTGAYDRSDFGAIVFATFSPEKLMPNNASYMQYLLGFEHNIAAFDINHACSGFVYGLWNAGIIAKNMGKKVLLLDADINSRHVSKRDKSTSLLFGDAGSATIITPEVNENEWNFSFMTDGSKRDSLTVNLATKSEDLEYQSSCAASSKRNIDMSMNGEDIFNYVVLQVPKYVRSFLEELEIEITEYDYLIMHQANAFMLRKLARKLEYPLENVPISIHKYGNTSSPSIPLNICSEIKDDIINKSNNLIVIGMGAGLSTGIASLNIDSAYCPGVIEVDL